MSQFSSVQFSSVTQLCLTLCDPMDCSMPDSQSLLKLMSVESVTWTFESMTPEFSWGENNRWSPSNINDQHMLDIWKGVPNRYIEIVFISSVKIHTN